MRTARSVALSLALVVAAPTGGATAQQQSSSSAPSSWSQSCSALTRDGLPTSTVRTFHDAVTAHAAAAATPPTPVQTAQVMRRLPVPMIVGVRAVSGSYDPRSSEVHLHIGTYTLRRTLTPDGRDVDETVSIEEVGGGIGKIHRIGYRMTVIEDRKLDHADRERPGQPPRADGGRWQDIGLAARAPVRMPGAGPNPDKGFGLTDDLHLVVAGSPRPPFATEEMLATLPVCQRCTLEHHLIRTVHVTLLCAAIVKGRTGRPLYIIQ